MPVFYLESNLTIDGAIHKKRTIDPLHSVSEKSKRGLIKQGLIRELQTPPIASFEALRNYAILLKKAGIETLGDFAFADLSVIQTRMKGAKEALAELQPKVRSMLNPESAMLIEDCGCGESYSAIPTYRE